MNCEETALMPSILGGSSGSAVSCALKAIRDARLTEHQKCVILLPDSIRNYMTKFLTTNWMLEKNLVNQKVLENKYDYSWWDTKVEQLSLTPPITIQSDQTIADACAFMQRNGLAQVAVVEDGYGEF